MAKNNRDKIGEALLLLQQALAPFVERELKATFRDTWLDAVRKAFSDKRHYTFDEDTGHWDAQGLLAVITKFWGETFARTLGRAERNLVGEIWEVRNQHAHATGKSVFTSQDTFRALDTMARLAESISAPEADLLRRGANDVLRLQFDEQSRHERRKAAKAVVEGQSNSSLRSWRDVVTPHEDVARGNFQRAEFAADLWRVYKDPGECAPEYGDSVEFFRRTYITAGLKMLLSSALKRLDGKGGDPVTQLQTNFGGGKTHSMLALFHLCSGHPLTSLPGMEELLQETGVTTLPKVSRVVLVGTKISPGQPILKEDGTEVRTLWGEMAWQIAGREGYELVRKADESGTNPNEESLRQLYKEYGPVLILIDEWVAYARQLHDDADLPGGSFETQFTFAQALTEAVSSVPNALLIVSLPASDAAFSDGSSPDESQLIEVGGQRGVEALRRLRNVIGRKDSPWRAASQEESYEIVRRRLFNPIADPELYRHRDATIRAFYDMYCNQPAEFPSDARKSDYETRMKAAYPIHLELFDRLYTDWSSLVKFQRTRGVLRLMASVVHILWEGDDRSPLILPGHVAIGDPSVEQELTRYLDDNWVPVIEKDVDGPQSLPLEIDRSNSNLGRFSATRRVARTIYMGSAPTVKASNCGLDEQRIKLGCVQPGETAAIFTDAILKLKKRATFLFDDDGRYWFSTSPSLNRMAEDEAERFKRKEDLVHTEIQRRLELDLGRDSGSFSKYHLCPASSHDVVDETNTRVVVLGPDKVHQRNEESEALKTARNILEKRGNAPRQNANTLVFLAADIQRCDELSQAVRQYLAWKHLSNLDEAEADLTAAAKRQIATRMSEYDSAVTARLAETWCWLLVPAKELRNPEIKWREVRLQGTASLAGRASHKLESDADLLKKIGPSVLRREIDKVPLWRGDHISIRQLVEDFAKHLYLPRLTNAQTLLNSISEGVALSSWELDGFAYADAFDEASGRYQGLKVGSLPQLGAMDAGLIVKPEVAAAQFASEAQAVEDDQDGTTFEGGASDPDAPTGGPTPADPEKPELKQPKHFHAAVTLTPTKLVPDVNKFSQEVLTHLASKLGVEIEITLDIEAKLDEGFDADTIRVVTENLRALKLEGGFED